MKVKATSMSAKKKTIRRPATSSPEKPIAPAEITEPPAKARPARKTLAEGVASVARKLFKRKTAAAKSAEPKTEVTAETLVRRTYTRRKKAEAAPEVPAILLEGDPPATPPVSGPGEKYSLGADAAGAKFSDGGVRTAGILRHQKIISHRARSALAVRALGFDARRSS